MSHSPWRERLRRLGDAFRRTGAYGVHGFLESRHFTLLVLLAALLLRFWRLGDANLWWDEALAAWAVRKGLLGATLWTASDVHPPLYFWSLWAWVRLFGESEFAMRSLSAFAGALTVALVYCVGELLAGRRTGNLAALLTALARFHVWWSQEMRMYVFAGLFGVASIYFLLRWWHHKHTDLSGDPSLGLLWLTAYVLSSVCAMYTIFLMGALLVAQNVTVLIAWLFHHHKQRWAVLSRWVLAQLVIAALVILWLSFSWGRMHTWSVANAPFDPLLFLRLYGTLLVTGISENIERYTSTLLLPAALLLVSGILALSRPRNKGAAFSTSAVGAMLLGTTVIAGGAFIYAATLPRALFYTPQVEARYFLPFAPAFWVLLAWGVSVIMARWRTMGVVSSMALLVLWVLFLPGHYNDRYLRDRLQTMSRTIVSQAREGDVVLLDSGNRYPIFLYDYERVMPGLWRPPVYKIPPGEGEFVPAQVQDTLAPILQQYSRIWLAQVDVNLADPQGLARHWLQDRLPEVAAQRFGANVLYFYEPEGQHPLLRDDYTPQHVLNMPVGVNGLLRGWELPVYTYTAGDSIHLSLLWDRLPENDYHIGLYTADGRLLALRRAEGQPGAPNRRQQFDWVVYPATPRGRYQIVLNSGPAQHLVLGSLVISGTRTWPRASGPVVAVDALLGEEIALVGYTLKGSRAGQPLRVVPGETLTLDLYWRANSKPQRDYTVFTHLLGQLHNPRSGGPLWAQHDSQPVDNGHPTSQWLQGQIVVDRHRLTVDDQAPEGEYRLEIGMYTAENGQRLAVVAADGQDPSDHILLETRVVIVER